MLTYYLKCKKDTEDVNSKVISTKNCRIMLLSKYTLCGNKKPRFIKEQEEKWLLSSVGVKTQLNKIPLLGGILF